MAPQEEERDQYFTEAFMKRQSPVQALRTRRTGSGRTSRAGSGVVVLVFNKALGKMQGPANALILAVFGGGPCIVGCRSPWRSK